MYITCSNNNRGSTVYESFVNAVRQYGLPSGIRCDQGGKHIVVSQYMPQKPNKWGMKAFILTDSATGYMYKWYLYKLTFSHWQLILLLQPQSIHAQLKCKKWAQFFLPGCIPLLFLYWTRSERHTRKIRLPYLSIYLPLLVFAMALLHEEANARV